MARKSLTKKTRFEVFKRDSFSCQYCGASAPDAVLNVDHINPVVNGGTNEIINLITACFDCNAGKGKRLLGDHAVVKRQIDQLKLAQERREQIQLMAQWRAEMVDVEQEKITTIAASIDSYLEPINHHTTDYYQQRTIKEMVKKYTLEDIWNAIDKSAAQYLRDLDSPEDRNKFLDYIPKIAYWAKVHRENPIEGEYSRLCGLTHKVWWRPGNRKELYRIIKNYHTNNGVPIKAIEQAIVNTTGITRFKEEVELNIRGDEWQGSGL